VSAILGNLSILEGYCEKKHKNTTFVRFRDYYLNIPHGAHRFLILLYRDACALNYLPLVFSRDI
jgi:hypothetical protein